MVLQPKQHKFSQSLKEKIFKDAKVSELNSDDTTFILPEWEISVRRHDDIAWSIVLAYLIEANHHENSNDFERRLKALTGSEDEANAVKKSIRSFNPFRNRFACFYNDTLKNAVEKFKANLNWYKLISVFDKISEASKALECQILLISDYPKTEKYRFFNSIKENSETPLDMITLIASTIDIDVDDEYRKITVYNFMIQESLGIKLKRAALIYFLKEVKVSKKCIRQTLSVFGNDNYLLISFLKKSYWTIILKLYSSSYIVSKISEVGFIMDPRTKDADGLSAFYHAIIAGNFKVLYKLYYFAADNCSSSESTYRNPDSFIVSNLSHMGEILSSDLLKLEDAKKNKKYQGRKKTLDELFRLNAFLLEVNKKMLKLKYKLNYYDKTPERIFEAKKRIDIIITLLETYKEFFNCSPQENSPVTPLDDFILHRNYYNLIDMATAIIFFDNIFRLRKGLRKSNEKNSDFQLKEELCLDKEKLFSSIELKEKLQVIKEEQISETESKIIKKKDLNEKSVSEMESSFFFLILYHIISEKLYSENEFLDAFALIKRVNTVDKITNFTEKLQRTPVNDESDLSFIFSEEIISIFYSYSKVKDTIHVDRLQDYVETALNVKVTTVGSVLAIERALQVIGEYVTPENNDNFYLRRFLSICLPSETSRILRRLRNQISHLKSWAFLSKIESEKNFSLFRSIQKEISDIQKYFEIVYIVLQMRTFIYAAQQLDENFNQIKSSKHLCGTFSNLYESEIYYVKSLPSKIFQKHKPVFLRFFEMALKKSSDEIMNENFNSDPNPLEKITEVRHSSLKPLKCLLKLLQKCGDFTKYGSVDNLLCMNKIICEQNYSKIDDFTASVKPFLCECSNLLANLQKNSCKVKKLKQLNIANIEYFLKTLKGFTFLTEDEKNKIRKEIPNTVRNSVLIKEQIIQSVKEGFSFKIDLLQSSEYQISYFSKNKTQKIIKLYETKDLQVLDLLNSTDPITELEDIFSKNSVGKKKYEELCEIMKFPDETQKKLGNLVAGQKKKVPGNNLRCLLNRVQLLKKIVIEDNEEVSKLWVKVKSQKSRQLIFDKIVHHYVRDHQQQAVTDMLLFDCMMLSEAVKSNENPWIKSQKLYTGINLRNVIAHGSPLLESLCKMIDPEDLPCEMVRKMIKLVEDEDTVQAILDLHDSSGHGYIKIIEVINSDERDKYNDLRSRIKRCDEWKDYVVLLPYNHPGVSV